MTRAGSRVAALGAGLVMIIATLAGCASAGARPSGPASSPPATSSAKLLGVGTVLDSGTGPQLCLGAVAESYPPQCGGPPIDGWTWPRSGVSRANGVTWGEFAVVGTYRDGRFQFDKIISQQQAAGSQPPPRELDLSTPCPAPPGGWRVLDPARVGDADRDQLFAAAERLRGYAGAWIDDRGHASSDPAAAVLDVQVTGSVSAAEQRLRRVWGGPLCVSRAAHSAADLNRVLDRLSRTPGFLSGGPERDGVLAVSVVHDDGTLQWQLDHQYGAGVVHVTSALRPYAG